MSTTSDPFRPLSHQPGIWTLDPSRSRVEFTLRQLFGKVRGHFVDFEAAIVTRDDITASTVHARLVLASVNTGNEKRDAHLQGPDFLKVQDHPIVSYTSTSLERSGDSYVLTGDLAIHGATRVVQLDLVLNEFGTDRAGQAHATFTASGHISRRAFGVTVPMDGGGVVISDRIKLRVELHAVRQS